MLYREGSHCSIEFADKNLTFSFWFKLLLLFFSVRLLLYDSNHIGKVIGLFLTASRASWSDVRWSVSIKLIVALDQSFCESINICFRINVNQFELVVNPILVLDFFPF